MRSFAKCAAVYGLIAALALVSGIAHAEVRSITAGDQTFEIEFETLDDVLARLNELSRENQELAPDIAAAAIAVFADIPGFDPESVVEAVGSGSPRRICDIVKSVNDVVEETIPGYPNCGEGLPEGGLEEQQSETSAAGPGDEDTEAPDPVSPN